MTNAAIQPLSLDDERHPLNILRKELNARRAQQEKIEKLLKEFPRRLYSGFESAVSKALAYGITNLGQPQRIPHPAGGWRQALRLPIDDWSIIIVPLVGAARPNLRDEARIPNARFKELSGSTAYFTHAIAVHHLTFRELMEARRPIEVQSARLAAQRRRHRSNGL